MNIQSISNHIVHFTENFLQSLSTKERRILLVASVIFALIALNYLIRNKDDSKASKASLFTGHGTFTTPNGDIMDGDFKEGKLNGPGKVTHKDGEIWEGEFKENKLHGPGKKTSADGTIEEGVFKHGVLVKEE
jgi:hypothetical protein